MAVVVRRSTGGMRVGVAARLSVRLLALLLVGGVVGGCLASADRSAQRDSGVESADAEADAEADVGDGAAELDRMEPWTESVTEIPFDDVRRPVAVLPELSAEAGELLDFRGVLTVRSSVPALQAAQIRCTRGDEHFESTHSTRNTPNDPEASSAVPVRWLFRAPADGRYRCALYGHADHQTEPDSYVLQVDEDATRLEVERDGIVGGEVWSINRDIDVENQATQNLFRHVTEANAEANTVSLYAGIEVTNNYEGRVYDYDSEVELDLTVQQLDDSGRPCGQSWTTSGRHRIPREIHHDKLELGFEAIPVRLERSCTRQFSVRGRLELVSGSPVTIHGPRYSDIQVLMR